MNSLDIPTKEPLSKQRYIIAGHPKGSYTDQAFYKKMNSYKMMNLSNLSQKQSIYDQLHSAHPSQNAADIDFNTLNPNKNPSLTSQNNRDHQFEIIAEFQLKRERQKNKILEERLKNKEIFIGHMKELQDQLTTAFENCQAELQYYKRLHEQNNGNQIREYVEQISQLKHLVIRLEEQINYHEQRQPKKRHFQSVKHQNVIDEEQENSSSRYDRKSLQKGTKRDHQESIVSKRQIKNKERSKTLMNNQDSPEFKKINALEEYILKYSNRIANFITQFLSMVECFSEDAVKAKKEKSFNSTKRRLKIGWKWVKEVVVEWNCLKNTFELYEKLLKKLKKIYKISEELDEKQSILTIIQLLDRK